jgi:predicted enzyme related to lactoylglutathione lyase
MPSTVYNVAFHCADAYDLASFWSQVVGQPLGDDDHPGDPVAVITMPAGFTLYFEQADELGAVTNRVHLCLEPDQQRDAEVARLVELGATIVADRRQPDGGGWVVFADPEGNEFCILRSTAERAAMAE